MKKLLLLFSVAIMCMVACKTGQKEEATEPAETDAATCKYTHLFAFSYPSDSDYYVQIDTGAILKIDNKDFIFIERGNHGQVQQAKSFTTSFKFWTVAKGAPAPDANTPPKESKDDTVQSGSLLNSPSGVIIQLVTKDPTKNVINPPIGPKPIGPIGG